MFIKPSKFLMIEADASPGNGAQAVTPATPAPTAAPTAPAVDMDDLVARLSRVIDEKVEAKHNASFAKMRRDGDLKKDKPQAESPAASTPTAATPGMTASDVKLMLERDRVITTRAVKFGLTDAQTARMRSALDAVQSGDSIAAEADAYLNDMGLAKAPTPTAPIAVTPTPSEPARPAPAAPAAPAKVDSVTNAGLVDLFNIPPEHFARMSPDDLRREFEKIAAVGRQNSGAPSRPKAPTR